jgi:hypothetical protein
MRIEPVGAAGSVVPGRSPVPAPAAARPEVAATTALVPRGTISDDVSLGRSNATSSAGINATSIGAMSIEIVGPTAATGGAGTGLGSKLQPTAIAISACAPTEPIATTTARRTKV